MIGARIGSRAVRKRIGAQWGDFGACNRDEVEKAMATERRRKER
jgi:hypothetical protein